jgi:glutathionylspermidine synthase
MGQELDRGDLREIERQLHLHYYKWDTQAGDNEVLSPQPLVIRGEAWDLLCSWAEELGAEAVAAENKLAGAARYRAPLGISKRLWSTLDRSPTAAPHNARVMRFDFHLTTEGWRISEVNSDVPGGWREGATLPALYHPFYRGYECPPSPLEAWSRAVASIGRDGVVALLCAPGYLEDEQVVRAFSQQLRQAGVPATILQSPAALRCDQGRCFLRRSGSPVSAIVRFYQVEWLSGLPKSTGWRELLTQSGTPVINPTISGLAQSKRFPVVLRDLGEAPTWEKLCPESRDPRDVDARDWDEWVLKACYSNTGDHVYLCAALPPDVRRKVIKDAQRNPFQYVAQKRFETAPVETCRGPMFPCVGVFVVNGSAAGAYLRLSTGQVTDGAAVEAPLFIDRAKRI